MIEVYRAIPDSVPRMTLTDGRRLAYEVSGRPDGAPVFLEHGTPGCGTGIVPRPSVLARRRVRLITRSRAGFWYSDRQKGRAVVDAAQDVQELADHLKIGKFAMVGRSGGVPHALACAALLGDRVTKTVTLCGPGLPGEMSWTDMAASNQGPFGREISEESVIRNLMTRYYGAHRDPENILRGLEPEMTPYDREVLNDTAVRGKVVQSFRDALVQGPYGWVDDVLALRNDWGFSLPAIQSPVTFWAATNDPFNPVGPIRKMASQVPQSELMILDRASHFTAITVLPDALSYAVR